MSELRRRNVIKVAVAYAFVTWLLIQVAETTFPILKLPEWSVTLVTVLLLIGFPLALIFAWAFELTPEGIKLERHVDRSQSITYITGRKLDYLIIAVLAVALAFFAYDKFVLDPARDAEVVRTTTEAVTEQVAKTATVDKSIAVLPFADMSPDGDQEYFSDGISEELLNVLARIPGLQVTARTSSFQFKGENRDIIDIGEQLNVGHILEGSVRKSGNQLRITAQLIKADDGFHLWSSSYDRELDDIFAVQDEIARAIIEALKEHLGPQVEATPRNIAAANVDAHEAYLRGRHMSVPGRVPDAIREFQKAVALDPDYALAHARLAILMLMRATPEAASRAAPHVEKAMDLDPGLAAAHAAAGRLSEARGNNEKALGHYEQAIQIDPNYSDVYVSKGNLLKRLGRYKESFAMTEMAVRLDPLSSAANYNYLRNLISQMRLDEAAVQVEKMVTIWPDLSVFCRSMLPSLGGKWADHIIGRLDALSPNHSNVSKARLTFQFAQIGLEKEVLAWSEYSEPTALRWLGRNEDAVTLARTRLADFPESLEALSDLGLALASAGDYERAQPILEESWQRTGEGATYQFLPHSAVALMLIRQNVGEQSGVAELAAAIRKDVLHQKEAGIKTNGMWSTFSPDYDEGLAAYFMGDHEEGLALIAQAVDDGFFFPPNEAYLQTLYDDPGFAPIRARQEARQTRERERFLAIVCTDNPYEEVWRPAQGTCEKFAAADVW